MTSSLSFLGDGDVDVGQQLVISEPRCKICQSEHRGEIDQMLRRGDTQASVRRYWNRVLGSEYFKPNNLSVHARNHLFGDDPTGWLQRSLRKARVLAPSASRQASDPRQALLAVMETGLGLIDAGLVLPSASDVIRSAGEFAKLAALHNPTEDEMLTEFKAFSAAVKMNTEQNVQDAIYRDFLKLLGEEEPKRW